MAGKLTKAQLELLRAVDARGAVGCATHVAISQALVNAGFCVWSKEPVSLRDLISVTDAGREALARSKPTKEGE